MSTAEAFDHAGRNRLLDSLPPPLRERFTAHLQPLALAFKQIVSEQDEPIRNVVFVTAGVVSLVTVLENDEIVEVATVGNEGMVGVPVLLGATSMPVRAIVQVPGHGLRMDADEFRAQLRGDSLLHEIFGRYTQALMTQMAISAACNRVHPIDQRCARWLLMTHDRVDSDRFPLTQEFLAQMLGVRRQSVNAAASILQRAGYISYRRGVITVDNREGLEAAACDCYRTVRNEFDRLFGPTQER